VQSGKQATVGHDGRESVGGWETPFGDHIWLKPIEYCMVSTIDMGRKSADESQEQINAMRAVQMIREQDSA
jgi:hypothetical protein